MNINPLDLILEQEERVDRAFLAAVAWRASCDLDNKYLWDETPYMSPKKLSKRLSNIAVAHGTISLYEHKYCRRINGSTKHGHEFLVSCWSNTSPRFNVLQKHGFFDDKETTAMTRFHVWFHSFASFALRCQLDRLAIEEIETYAHDYSETLRETWSTIKALPTCSWLPKEPMHFLTYFIESPDLVDSIWDMMDNAFIQEGWKKST